MDEMAEKLKLDPVEFTQVVPDNPARPPSPDPQSLTIGQAEAQKQERPFSQRQFVECLRMGAKRFGWSRRNAEPGRVREGRWLVGMGVAAAFRNNQVIKSAARVRLDHRGMVTVETDMTDVGTGSYTIIAQTAAEMLGVPVEKVAVRLGDSNFPVSSGSGGQCGANCSTAGVYVACVKLREAAAQRLGLDPAGAVFSDGHVQSGGRRVRLAEAAGASGLVAEDAIEFGDMDKRFQQSTFGAHFVEVGVDAATGETRAFVAGNVAIAAAQGGGGGGGGGGDAGGGAAAGRGAGAGTGGTGAGGTGQTGTSGSRDGASSTGTGTPTPRNNTSDRPSPEPPATSNPRQNGTDRPAR